MCCIGDVIHMLYLTVMTQIRRWKGCTNQVRCGGVCMKHGAKKKLCSSDGCTNGAVNGGVCKTHGAKVKLCSSEGCTNYSKKGGVCIKHGAVMKRCKIEGCTSHIQSRGLCKRHGKKWKQFSGEGGTNQSQKGGNVCKRHGETLYYALCSTDGCTNQVQLEASWRQWKMQELYLQKEECAGGNGLTAIIATNLLHLELRILHI